MKKRTKIIISVIVLIIAGYIFLLMSLMKSSSSNRIGASEGGSIALIRISGVISGDGDSQVGASGTSPEKIINNLKQAEEDDSVKAILLRVNSPGGTTGASEEIYTAIKRVRKPVIVSVSDICASGAYWISAGADKIVANPASEVGSIGVILEIPDLKKLFDKLGVNLQVVNQGKYKDIGNPARSITEEERKILNAQTKTIYDIFINDISKSRKIPLKKVQELANGLTYPAVDAIKYGLIDKLGNYQDAVNLASELGHIKGTPEIVEYEKPGLFDFFGQFFSSRSKINMLADNINKPFIPFSPFIKR